MIGTGSLKLGSSQKLRWYLEGTHAGAQAQWPARRCKGNVKFIQLVQMDSLTHQAAAKRSKSRRKPLLTGWSLVRIRPGEPNKIKVLDDISASAFWPRMASGQRSGQHFEA
jgi:hypothetical protein